MLYTIIFLILWIIFFLIRIKFSKGYDKKVIEKSVRRRVEIFLTFLNFIGMVLIPVGFSVLNFFNVPFPAFLIIPISDWVVVSSLAVLAGSLVIFFLVHKELGRNWSPVLEIRSDHTLVKTGLYRRIRHPMYLQLWIWVIFQGLALRNWAVEIVGIAAWAVLYYIRVGAEEKMMSEKFGREYEMYRKDSGRIFPKFGKREKS